MTRPRPLATFGCAAVAMMLALAPACGRRRPAAPAWALAAPAATVMAVSGQAGWVLEQPGFQAFIEKYPYADQALDLFLKRAHIDPHLETGRITFYALSFPAQKGEKGQVTVPEFVIHLGGFKNQSAVHMAITDAFPAEGFLPLGKQEFPVYVVLDFNQYHFRAVADPAGGIWLGELRSLATLGAGPLPHQSPVLHACEWINGAAPIQGFLRPQAILEDLSGRVPPELAKNLPKGIDALAWSVTPGGPGKDGLHRFELSLSGSREGVVQVAPWIQRFVAIASSVQGTTPAQAPEILQEKHRIGLRCRLSGEQINQAMGKLWQPGISFASAKP